jgi:SAM-dependent methyltransferase
MQDGLLRKAEELERRSIFLGGPKNKFIAAGRGQLEILLSHGLAPDDRVLDIGCGALRGGWWLIHFLRPERYFGIEPNQKMLEAGIEVMLGPELLAEKKPRFSHNDDFDFAVFGQVFDFFLARSVWTHASKNQIRAMLHAFHRCSHPGSLFLTSMVELDHPGASEYSGTDWVGRSHLSDTAGMVQYRFDTIEHMCRSAGLNTERLGVSQSQLWVKISRPR